MRPSTPPSENEIILSEGHLSSSISPKYFSPRKIGEKTVNLCSGFLCAASQCARHFVSVLYRLIVLISISFFLYARILVKKNFFVNSFLKKIQKYFYYFFCVFLYICIWVSAAQPFIYRGCIEYHYDNAYKKYKYNRITIHNNIYKQKAFCPAGFKFFNEPCFIQKA